MFHWSLKNKAIFETQATLTLLLLVVSSNSWRDGCYLFNSLDLQIYWIWKYIFKYIKEYCSYTHTFGIDDHLFPFYDASAHISSILDFSIYWWNNLLIPSRWFLSILKKKKKQFRDKCSKHIHKGKSVLR